MSEGLLPAGRGRSGQNLLFSIKGDKDAFYKLGKMETSIVKRLGDTADMQLISRMKGGSVDGASGYVIEVALPLIMLQLEGINIKDGNIHKFAVCINDRDSKNEIAETKLCFPITWSWGKLGTFADIIFK